MRLLNLHKLYNTTDYLPMSFVSIRTTKRGIGIPRNDAGETSNGEYLSPDESAKRRRLSEQEQEQERALSNVPGATEASSQSVPMGDSVVSSDPASKTERNIAQGIDNPPNEGASQRVGIEHQQYQCSYLPGPHTT